MMNTPANRLSLAMERMFIAMQEVDDTCVRLTEDIEKRDLALIGFVGDNNEVIMRDIANYLDIPVSTTTGIVEKLVKKSYLKRQFSPNDRRSIKIVLDQKGKETFQLFNDMRHSMSERIIGCLDPSEAEHFIQLMEKVTTSLRNNLELA